MSVEIGSISIQPQGSGVAVTIYERPDAQGGYQGIVLTPSQALSLARDLKRWALHVNRL